MQARRITPRREVHHGHRSCERCARHRRLRDPRGGCDDDSGSSVSSAGDVNGDGFDDLIIGATVADGPGAAPGTRSDAGDSYVVFGRRAGFGAAIDLVNVAAGIGGFVIHGADADDRSGISVSSAGDINGDGFDDLIIGAPVPTVPARRRARATMPATAMWCSARPAGSARRSIS